jgi:hypothetical protein
LARNLRHQFSESSKKCEKIFNKIEIFAQSEIRCGFGLNADGLKEEGGFANAIQKFIENGQNNKNDEEMEEENSMEALNAHLPNQSWF